MKLGVVSFFNEEAFLRRCLLSLRGQVDLLIGVDGRYDGYPDEPYSTDGSFKIAKEYCDKLFKKKGTEIEKRNSYLIGKEGDVYIHLDADEELIGTLPENLTDSEIFIKKTTNLPGMWLFRIFKHRANLEYRHRHHLLYAGEICINKLKLARVTEAYIKHYTLERDLQRTMRKGTYLEELKRIEPREM